MTVYYYDQKALCILYNCILPHIFKKNHLHAFGQISPYSLSNRDNPVNNSGLDCLLFSFFFIPTKRAHTILGEKMLGVRPSPFSIFYLYPTLLFPAQ